MKYKYLIIPFVTMMLAQIIKFIIETIKYKKINVSRLLNGNGGMPSSHTSFTISLAFAIGLGEGFDTPLFACTFIFAIIVAYDSMGLRMESGKQAVMINKLVKKTNLKEENIPLKEMIGHKPLEVYVGIIFGCLSAYIQMMLFS